MVLDPSAIAERFGLGQPVAPLRPLSGLSDAAVWALRTERGRWVVKAAGTATSESVRLELAARLAGVSTATPVPPVPGRTVETYWSKVDGALVRVWEHIEGGPPGIPPPPSVAAWLGRTIATIGGLALLPDTHHPLPVDPQETSIPMLQWAVDELAEVAAAPRPPVVLCHRDINRRNILVGPDGPVLLDFDHAGPQAPWWELVHHAFFLSCLDLGPEEPDAATIRPAIAAYQAAGGVIGATDRTAFGALAGGLLEWFNTARRAGNRANLRRAEVSLPLVARSLDRWTLLLH